MSFFKSNRNIRVLLALLLAPVMAFTSCLEVIDDGSEAVGYLAPVSVAFDLSVDELTATKALPLPTIESPNEADILFVVKDQNGNVVHSDYGRWEGTLVIPVGNYTVEASYGANAFGSPYFYGSVSGKVGPYENQTLPDINLKVGNSLVAVTIKDELDQHFTCETVTFKSGTTTFSGSLGEYCFVPSGRDLSVVLGGKNSMNKPSTFSYQLAKPLARSAYEVICEKASTNWPSISFTSDKIVAWANRIYVTSPADFSGAISSDNKETVVYEAIPSSSSDWSLAKTSVKDNGIPVIKRLDTGTEYKVRARAGVLVSPEVKVTPNFSGLATSAEHTSTSGLLDGTDVTVSFAHASSAVKASIKSWTLNLCKSDGTVLRSGLSIGTTSDGSQITSSTGWPYLPEQSGETYKITASATMSDGEIIPTEISFDVPDTPDFSISMKSYTSYDKYAGTNGIAKNLNEANNSCDPSTIYDVGASWGISLNLMKNTNYPKTLLVTDNSTEIRKYEVESFDANSFYEPVSGCQWQAHELKVSVTFAGKTCSTTRTHHVTGLPYNINFATSASGWTLEKKCTRKDDGLHFDPTATPYANLSFHVPANLNVSLFLYSGVQLNATSLISIAHLDVKIGSENNDKVLKAPSNFAGGKTTTTTETEVKGTLMPSAPSIELKTNDLVSGMWVIVPGVRLVYR